jgi:hypothetical protein
MDNSCGILSGKWNRCDRRSVCPRFTFFTTKPIIIIQGLDDLTAQVTAQTLIHVAVVLFLHITLYLSYRISVCFQEDYLEANSPYKEQKAVGGRTHIGCREHTVWQAQEPQPCLFHHKQNPCLRYRSEPCHYTNNRHHYHGEEVVASDPTHLRPPSGNLSCVNVLF